MNEPDYFWKNFRLGTELQTAGNFIYNGLFFLDKLEWLHFEEDIFEFLYNISVGIERIQKIIIVMSEHNESLDQVEFEKSLLTHNHTELLRRIQIIHQLNLGKVHSKFLGLLTNFYNSYRYIRFNKSSVYHKNFDKFDFLEFISKELKVEIQKGDYIQNSKQVKNFIGKAISKIACDLYEIIRKEAVRIGTFTYEIRYNSKAFKIFIAKEFTFEQENNFKKEILVSLINGQLNDEFIEYIKSLKPILLEEYNSSHYIKYLINPLETQHYINEYEYMFEEKVIPRNRDSEIEPIGESQYLSTDFDNLENLENED